MNILPLLLLATLLPAMAEPKKILVIGDSQSEEYRFEIPFSAPESDPFESNTQNWIEILAEHRPDEVTFGEYKRNAFSSYPDVRNAGYEYNWSIPGALTDTWIDIFNSTIFDDQEFLTSKFTLLDQISEVDAVVIFLGGNDMNTVYSRLQRDEPPANWPQSVLDQMEEIISVVRNESANIPIVVGDFPDVGGTEKRKLDFPDRSSRDLACQYIAQANLLLRELLAGKNIPVFEVSRITTDLIDDQPFRFGNVEMLPLGHPENPPRYLLCRDGFHPSTSSQARIANMIVGSLNEATGWSLTPFSDNDILTDILGIDPTIDDDYLAWANEFELSNNSLIADPDEDGIDNLGEFALGNLPNLADAPCLLDGQIFDFNIDPSRINYVKTTPAVSSNLRDWTPFNAAPPFTLPQPFARLDFDLLDTLLPPSN